MPDLELIGGPQSNYVWTCRIALAEKGVPYTLTATMPHTPVADATHPLGKIPSIRHGDVTLCESRAICAYIDRAFTGPPLMPLDVANAAEVEQWISIVNTGIQPVTSQYLSGYFFPARPTAVLIARASTPRCRRWSRCLRCSTVPSRRTATSPPARSRWPT